MAAKLLSGGEGLKAKLKELAKLANQNALLKVGFFEGSTENKSNVPTAYVALCNEYGGTIPERTVPAHMTKLYRKVDKSGNLLNGGKFTRRSKSNFETEHFVPEHKIPAHKVPSRPFFRRMIKLGEPHWADDLGKALVRFKYDSKRAMNYVGIQMTDELRNSIQARVYAPLAASTIAKKGNDQTLIDSSDMNNAVAFEVSL